MMSLLVPGKVGEKDVDKETSLQILWSEGNTKLMTRNTRDTHGGKKVVRPSPACVVALLQDSCAANASKLF